MAFDTTIAGIPFTPTSDTGTGFLPPVVRAMGHFLALTSRLSDKKATIPSKEILEEINDAAKHWAALNTQKGVMSDASITRTAEIAKAMKEMASESKDWDNDKTATNARNLCNRIVQFMAELDRELLGLRDSDPGNSL